MPEMRDETGDGEQVEGDNESPSPDTVSGSAAKATIEPEGDPYKYTVDDDGTIGIISEDGSEMVIKSGLMEKVMRKALTPLAEGTPAYDLLMQNSSEGSSEDSEESAEEMPTDPMEVMERLKKKAISRAMGKGKKKADNFGESSDDDSSDKKEY
jgi:hypothetical protein